MNHWPKELQVAGVNLKAALLKVQPEVAQAMLGGFLATIAGQIPEEHWQKMMALADKPCGVPRCGCEKFKGPMMIALNALRDDYRKTVPLQN